MTCQCFARCEADCVCDHDWTPPVVKDMRAEIERLRAENEALRDALISIEEYWNRDRNEKAMADACWHAVETAHAALAAKGG